MSQKVNSEVAACKRCGRALSNDDKLGLCADCTNKFGTPLIIVGAIALGALAKRFGSKAVGLAIDLVKR